MAEKNCYADSNLILLKEYRSGNVSAKEQLIKNNMGLVTSISKRFCGRGTDFEDLIQIGIIGLLKSIEGFDENTGCSFSTYAFPHISGEIKRFLRDDGQIKLSRITKQNARIVTKEKQAFIKEYGREPKISEIAEKCHLSEDAVIDCLNASTPPVSLEDKVGGGEGSLTVGELIKDDDCFADITDILALHQAIDELCEFERNVIILRFFKNITQNATARILGTSQVTISRSEKKIIDKLRQKIL